MDAVCVIDNKICRICFQTHCDTISLHNKKCGRSPYEKLTTHTNLNIALSDGGPKYICGLCNNELNILIEFLNKCERANLLLLQYKENLLGELENNPEHKDDKQIIYKKECFEHNNISNNEISDSVKESTQFPKNVGNITKSPVRHTCQYCSKVFTRKFNLKLHVMRHSGVVPPSRRATTRRACPILGCEKTFTSVTNLNTHIRKHNGERPYECTECGKTFRSSTTLNDHRRIHTGVKPYMCPTCGKRFTTNKLSAHMRTHADKHAGKPADKRADRPADTSARRHACALCGARYRHAQSLRKHLRKRHAAPAR